MGHTFSHTCRNTHVDDLPNVCVQTLCVDGQTQVIDPRLQNQAPAFDAFYVAREDSTRPYSATSLQGKAGNYNSTMSVQSQAGNYGPGREFTGPQNPHGQLNPAPIVLPAIQVRPDGSYGPVPDAGMPSGQLHGNPNGAGTVATFGMPSVLHPELVGRTYEAQKAGHIQNTINGLLGNLQEQFVGPNGQFAPRALGQDSQMMAQMQASMDMAQMHHSMPLSTRSVTNGVPLLSDMSAAAPIGPSPMSNTETPSALSQSSNTASGSYASSSARFCTECGVSFTDTAKFCAECGCRRSATGPPSLAQVDQSTGRPQDSLSYRPQEADTYDYYSRGPPTRPSDHQLDGILGSGGRTLLEGGGRPRPSDHQLDGLLGGGGRRSCDNSLTM